MEDTRSIENAYRRFGNVKYVDHWFKAECFKPAIRNADRGGKVIGVTKITVMPRFNCISSTAAFLLYLNRLAPHA